MQVVALAHDEHPVDDAVPISRDWAISSLRGMGMTFDEVALSGPPGATVRQMITALDNVREAIVVLSTDRSVVYRNRAAHAMFDHESEIVLPESAWEHLERGRTWKGNLIAQQGGEERHLRFYAKPLLGLEGDRSYLLVVHDVTEMARLQSIADAVNFSDNLGHFLSGIRHELGNPVNSIKTALTVLRANLDGFGPAKVADYLDRVLGEVSRIEYLLHWLRSFSVNEVVVLGRVELADFMREVVALVEPSANRAGVTLEVEPSPRVAVTADARALCQVVLNLVSNAIEALSGMPGDPTLHIDAAVVDDRVEIVVADNGPGMPAEIQALAMRPFFTTKRTGTGLGLVIAQRLVATQGGRLRLSSEPGVGTRAVVSLPRALDLEEDDA
jgi:signal transduction histidine kinase